MKRTDLIRHLERHGCEFQGPKIFCSSTTSASNDFLARKICDDLQIPRP